MRRGTKTRSDSDSPDITNMNHANDGAESSMLDEGATSPSSGTSHSKSGKHEDSKKERVVKVALPGAKKAQSAAKKKKSTPDLVSWKFLIRFYCARYIVLHSFSGTGIHVYIILW